jgi:L-amino acid N-acyltransferase YncA
MREVGYKFDQWIDVLWFQKMLHPVKHATPAAHIIVPD